MILEWLFILTNLSVAILIKIILIKNKFFIFFIGAKRGGQKGGPPFVYTRMIYGFLWIKILGRLLDANIVAVMYDLSYSALA